MLTPAERLARLMNRLQRLQNRIHMAPSQADAAERRGDMATAEALRESVRWAQEKVQELSALYGVEPPMAQKAERRKAEQRARRAERLYQRIAKAEAASRVAATAALNDGDVVEYSVFLYQSVTLVRAHEVTGAVWCLKCEDRGDCIHARAVKRHKDVRPLYAPTNRE